MITIRLRTFSISLMFALTSTQASTDPAEQPAGDGWFCEQGAQNKEWVCVQSETINPDTADTPVEQEKRDVRPLKELLEKAEPAPTPVRNPEPVAISVAKSEPDVPVDSNLPLYVQLAYKPGQAINISELPPEFYVVQLMSLSNKSNLEAYFGEHKLTGLSAARVESNGAILYVLLLGIYENLANAKQASDHMPVQLNKIKPWIRSLGSLQKAMVRADGLTGSSDF